jgi:hypothetical protein
VSAIDVGVTAEPLTDDRPIAKLRSRAVDHNAPATLLAAYDQLELAGVQFGKGGAVGHAGSVTGPPAIRGLSLDKTDMPKR